MCPAQVTSFQERLNLNLKKVYIWGKTGEKSVEMHWFILFLLFVLKLFFQSVNQLGPVCNKDECMFYSRIFVLHKIEELVAFMKQISRNLKNISVFIVRRYVGS